MATLGSLYLSEVANFAPCRLCWYQRIAMYPLVPILAVAIWRRDAGVRFYALPVALVALSAFALIAVLLLAAGADERAAAGDAGTESEDQTKELEAA